MGIYDIARLGIVAEVMPVQPSNASTPMQVTLSGIITLVRLVQSLNAESGIESPEVITTVVNESFGIYDIARLGIVAEVMPAQPENASSPIEVTLSGITMLVILAQLENAYS